VTTPSTESASVVSLVTPGACLALVVRATLDRAVTMYDE
jgi:hypothetical protein